MLILWMRTGSWRSWPYSTSTPSLPSSNMCGAANPCGDAICICFRFTLPPISARLALSSVVVKRHCQQSERSSERRRVRAGIGYDCADLTGGEAATAWVLGRSGAHDLTATQEITPYQWVHPDEER